MKNWCALFVKTGMEEKTCQILKQAPLPISIVPFVPMRKSYYRKSGDFTIEKKVCFPGYVFIETDAAAIALQQAMLPVLAVRDNIFRILSYGNQSDIFIRERERLALLELYGPDLCIENSIGVIEGDTVRVAVGPLAGQESRIRKINRRKREALIDIELLGDQRQIYVALEITEKISR